MSITNNKIVLKQRPEGVIVPNVVFKTITETLPANLKPKQFIVKNHYISIDPAMRGWLRNVKSYIPPVAIGEVMRAGTVGVVVRSAHSRFPVGSWVSCGGGFQEYTLFNNGGGVSVIDAKNFKPTLFLGTLGLTGLTAYFGFLRVGKPKAGDTVLVSGAAGATGSVVGQIAKILGCRVVGLAGSEEKCRHLTEVLGFDAAINYKTCKSLNAAIKETCPNDVDVYFDNVGGKILNAALRRLNRNARVVICGAISQYNKEKGTEGPSNYLNLLVTRSSMQGFVVFDYAKDYQSAIQEMGKWIKEGKLKFQEHIVEGLENAPNAINILFSGQKKGKLIVKINHEAKL